MTNYTGLPWIGPRPISFNITGRRNQRACPSCGRRYYRDHTSSQAWGRSYQCETCRDIRGEQAADDARQQRREVEGELVREIRAMVSPGAPSTGPKRAPTDRQVHYLAARWSERGLQAFRDFIKSRPDRHAPMTALRISTLIDASL